MTVWILGANGFIGKHLIEELSGVCTVHKVSHTNDSWKRFPVPEFVINLAASGPDATEKDSRSANIDFPTTVINHLRLTDHHFKWVQIASYFEYQCSMGRKDRYSIHKLEFRTWLASKCQEYDIELTSLVLPHVFGAGEKSNRLIPSAAYSFHNGIVLRSSAGEQFLPILNVYDACRAISCALNSSQEICSAFPFWYGRVKELLQIIQAQVGRGQFRLDPDWKSIDHAFPRIVFPEPVINWRPLRNIESLTSHQGDSHVTTS